LENQKIFLLPEKNYGHITLPDDSMPFRG
jgi:hypothetical protein